MRIDLETEKMQNVTEINEAKSLKKQLLIGGSDQASKLRFVDSKKSW